MTGRRGEADGHVTNSNDGSIKETRASEKSGRSDKCYLIGLI